MPLDATANRLRSLNLAVHAEGERQLDASLQGFRVTIDIHRPATDVFTFLADGTHTPLWYEAIERAERLTPDPVAQGTRYRFIRYLPGGRVENLVEVSAYEPVRRVTLTSLEGPTPFTYRYTLQAYGATTRLRLDGEISGAGLRGPATVLAPLASRLFARGMHKNLTALKQILEQPTTAHGDGVPIASM